MEFIQTLLNRPNVVSVQFTKSSVQVLTKDYVKHNYSMEYFTEHIVPKIMGEAK